MQNPLSLPPNCDKNVGAALSTLFGRRADNTQKLRHPSWLMCGGGIGESWSGSQLFDFFVKVVGFFESLR